MDTQNKTSNTNPFLFSSGESGGLTKLAGLEKKRRDEIDEYRKKKRDATLASLRQFYYEQEVGQKIDPKDEDASSEVGAFEAFEKKDELELENDLISKLEKPGMLEEKKDDTSSKKKAGKENKMGDRKKMNSFAKRLTVANHMISPPSNLNGDYWFVYSKPDGIRCLVTTGDQRTIARDKNGFFLKAFKTMLPGGSQYSDSKKICTLDCIFDQRSLIFYIMDVIIWEGNPIFNNSAESRFFCIDASILADRRVTKVDPNKNELVFSTVRKWDCSVEGFKSAYAEKTDYLKDGLYFYHKEAEYFQSLNPYLLWWKDHFISLYPFGSTKNGEEPDKYYTVLELNNKNNLQTLECYELCPMPPELKKKENYYTGNLLVVSIAKISINEYAEEIQTYFKLEGIEILRRASIKKARPDSLAKIASDYIARNCPISADHITEIIKKASEEVTLEQFLDS